MANSTLNVEADIVEQAKRLAAELLTTGSF
jgi:hypothetical protein